MPTSFFKVYEMAISLREEPGFFGNVSSSTPLLYLALSMRLIGDAKNAKRQVTNFIITTPATG